MTRIVEPSSFSLTAFVKDVSLAWNLVKKRSIFAIERNKIAISMGLETRYALILASICTIANNIPPLILANLLEARIMSSIQEITIPSRVTSTTSNPWKPI
jgi:hypothetical protein